MKSLPTVLAVGGSDPTAGAGIQADIRTFESFGVQSAAVVTAITVQTPARVLHVRAVSPALIRDQLRAVLDSMEVHAVKIGMLPTAAAAAAVARVLDDYEIAVVVDPVMRPTRGRPLATDGVARALVAQLLPLATCVTANLSEAARLTGFRVDDLESMKAAARALVDLGPSAAVVKGGHLAGAADDVLWDGRRLRVFAGARIRASDLHGSGCAFASAMAALLARGRTPAQAVAGAKRHVRMLIETSIGAAGGRRMRTPAHHTRSR